MYRIQSPEGSQEVSRAGLAALLRQWMGPEVSLRIPEGVRILSEDGRREVPVKELLGILDSAALADLRDSLKQTFVVRGWFGIEKNWLQVTERSLAGADVAYLNLAGVRAAKLRLGATGKVEALQFLFAVPEITLQGEAAALAAERLGLKPATAEENEYLYGKGEG
jgi:hypothetical protein